MAHRVQRRWKLTAGAEQYQRLFEALLFAGNMRLAIANCIEARLVRGKTELPGMSMIEVTEALIFFYLPPKREAYSVYHSSSPSQHVKLSSLCPHAKV